LTEHCSASFERLFGRRASACAAAPGRVNLIGEHTDYNGGFVLPIATPQKTAVAIAGRPDRLVRVWSANISEGEGRAEFQLGSEARTGGWIDYVAGVTAALGAAGHRCGGFDACVESDLPLGGGLSSSASLEVAVLRSIRKLFCIALDSVGIAKIAHRAETELVGAPVGIMDQMAASLADADDALFLDTKTLAFERLPLPAGVGLIVIHSGVAHRHAGGEYRTRRAECDEAARRLGVAWLRDVDAEHLQQAALPPPLDRRARHVVTENARVLQARDALTAGDPRTLGTLMSASHESMRDDFEISTPEIDTLVTIAQGESGVFGARLTGGGFGGSIVALARADGIADAAARIAAEYERRVALRPTILIPVALSNPA
jgi:galactokinase